MESEIPPMSSLNVTVLSPNRSMELFTQKIEGSASSSEQGAIIVRTFASDYLFVCITLCFPVLSYPSEKAPQSFLNVPHDRQTPQENLTAVAEAA